MAADKALKFWTGSAQLTRNAKAWDQIIIAAYSERDAAQLYVEAGGGSRGAMNHVRSYMGHRSTPNPLWKFPVSSRGIHFTDRNYGSVLFQEAKGRTVIDEAPEDAKAAAAAQQMPEDYGRLRVGFQRSVKVCEWTFSSPYADRALADRMKAEVRMRHTNTGLRKREEGIEFVATSECFDKGKELSHANIEKLFELVQEEFRTYDLAQRGVVWEDWLEITVHNTNIYDAKTSAGLSVGYKPLKRGVDPRNGRVMTIHDSNHVVIDFPKARAAGVKPKKDDDDWHIGDIHQIAFLPATPENIAALDTIMAAIHTARVRLEGLLNQRDISKTLASIPTVLLLESTR